MRRSPLPVFTYATGPYEEWHRIAWAAALVLMAWCLILLGLAARWAVRQKHGSVPERPVRGSRPPSSRAFHGKRRRSRTCRSRSRPTGHRLIGPSGCGKSTFLRSLNRMHELSDGGWVTGRGAARRRRTSTSRP